MRTLGVREWTGRTVLFLILAFFGVVFAANGVFIYLATASWTGLSTEDAYRKGLAYNATIERAEAQAALGWQTALTLAAHGTGTQRLTLSLRDRAGRPIEGRSVTAMLRRPLNTGGDVAATLTWAGAERYAADLSLPQGGQWLVQVEIMRDDAPPYLIETRLWPN